MWNVWKLGFAEKRNSCRILFVSGRKPQGLTPGLRIQLTVFEESISKMYWWLRKASFSQVISKAFFKASSSARFESAFSTLQEKMQRKVPSLHPKTPPMLAELKRLLVELSVFHLRKFEGVGNHRMFGLFWKVLDQSLTAQESQIISIPEYGKDGNKAFNQVETCTRIKLKVWSIMNKPWLKTTSLLCNQIVQKVEKRIIFQICCCILPKTKCSHSKKREIREEGMHHEKPHHFMILLQTDQDKLQWRRRWVAVSSGDWQSGHI